MIGSTDETLARHTFDQVVPLRDVLEQFVEICIAFAARDGEAGDRHEVCGNVIYIVRRILVGAFRFGRVFTVLNKGWGSGTTAGSISREFERGRELFVPAGGGKGPIPSVTFVDSGVFKFFSQFVLGRHGYGKSRDRDS